MGSPGIDRQVSAVAVKQAYKELAKTPPPRPGDREPGTVPGHHQGVGRSTRIAGVLTRARGPQAVGQCTDRDAPFVLDSVLYHESDLDLEEHYTDTHGYTEINFAAFGMVGMRFCPRIRSLHRQRIYCAEHRRTGRPQPRSARRADGIGR